MATETQVLANRLNSQKSTGPRSAAGKAAVSQNAVKHGLFAHEAVVKGENQADFDLFRDEMLGELAAVGAMESMLAERVVSLSWRLKRAERMQNQAIDGMIEHKTANPLAKHIQSLCLKAQGLSAEDTSASDERLALGRIAIKDYSNSRVLDRLLMYERRIEHSLFKTMGELQRLRLLRELERGDAGEEQSAPEPSPPPEKEVYYEKQSQFAPAQVGANSFLEKDYDSRPALRLQKNKAKQSQYKDRSQESEYRIQPTGCLTATADAGNPKH